MITKTIITKNRNNNDNDGDKEKGFQLKLATSQAACLTQMVLLKSIGSCCGRRRCF